MRGSGSTLSSATVTAPLCFPSGSAPLNEHAPGGGPMGRGSRMATLASTTPSPSPTRAHSAGRPELETAGWGAGGRLGLRERGPPRPLTEGVAHPLGAGRRPFGGNTSKAFPSRAAWLPGTPPSLDQGRRSKSGMDVNDLILKFLVCIDCPQLSLY